MVSDVRLSSRRFVAGLAAGFVAGLSMSTASIQASDFPERASQHPRDANPPSSGQSQERPRFSTREVLSPSGGIRLQEDLATKEYWITWQDETQLEDLVGAWHAPNRAQGFRTYFTAAGIRLIPRAVGRPAWEWSLTLVAYGRGTISRPVEQARPYADENRIWLDRVGIVEWLVNEPRGLKHGFVLHAPPEDGAEPLEGGGAVHLELAVGGGLTPILGADGQLIRFAGSSGLGVIHYGGLEARDAGGRVLPAWMETSVGSRGWTVRLLLDDSGAAYPVEIDPLATSAAWTGEVDQAGARFGVSVATAGDVNADGYDDVIVGAFHYDNGATNEGAAFLYLGSAAGPSPTHDWKFEGTQAVALAGRSVGTAGDVNGDGYDDVIVGTPALDNGGGAWVFHGSATGPSASPAWMVQSDRPNNSSFGFSVGTAGDVNGDGYDDVIVGARLYDSPGFIQDGRAYVYHGSPSGLSTEPTWITAGKQSNASYGHAVGTAGDVNGDGYDDVIVSAYMFDNGQLDEGRAFGYYGSPAGLSMAPDWIFENDDVRACLGIRVGSAGDVDGDGYDDVVVGAGYNSCFNAPTSPVGKAYGFYGSVTGLSEPDWIVELAQTGAVFGLVATAGDVNGDGHDDVVVGASLLDNGETDEGAAFLYLGSQAGLSDEHAWMAEGDQNGALFGFSARTAGDANGDGVADVVVGAYNYDHGESDEGRAFLYLGSADIAPAGRVPADAPLLLAKGEGGALQLSWGPSCLAGDLDYEVYEGQLGDFASHTSRLCSTGGQTTITLVPGRGGTYFLIVPRSPNGEGSYGTTSARAERPPGSPACLPQAIGSCE